ncbi:MAG: pyridoxamine 5'-phosphate oxidase family protein [Pseudomonadota bacterium]
MLLKEHQTFLRSVQVPLRLSIAKADEPMLVPLWFIYQDNFLWCACHRNSYLVQRIRAQSGASKDGIPCAFDVSTNEPPYRGVAGKGRVKLVSNHGAEKLQQLTERYLRDVTSEFGRWLLARAEEEEALCIAPTRVRAWDYTDRMSR